MICLIQRVTQASVTVEDKTHASINQGLLVFLGVLKTDTEQDVSKLVQKLTHLRVMDDGAGKMNRTVVDVSGELLVISQFTLAANLKGGRRPDFFPAMEPSEAKRLYELFIKRLSEANIPVKSGVFGALMRVDLTNDGPATFILDSNQI